jgi:formylglycine-generating enzyme required for sulfatase activity
MSPHGYVAVGMACRPACVDVDCNGHGTCVQKETGVGFLCDPGYVASGDRCIDDTLPGGDGGRDGAAHGQGGICEGDGGPAPTVPGTWVAIDVSGAPFVMGSPETEWGRIEGEVEHQVTLTRSFWMMTTEVTQAQFHAVMGFNPSYFGPTGSGDDCGMNCPVEALTWDEMAGYGNALSHRAGLAQCYDCTGAAPGILQCSLSAAYGTPYDCPGYRLPLEAEWEYAVRAGTTTANYNGNLNDTFLYFQHSSCTAVSPELDPIAWWCANSDGRTHPVAANLPNSYGLYDMLGNVYEWCHDRYGPYSGQAEVDPLGAAGGTERVIRGASMLNNARGGRSAFRYGVPADSRNGSIGGRIVRSCL